MEAPVIDGVSLLLKISSVIKNAVPFKLPEEHLFNRVFNRLVKKRSEFKIYFSEQES